MRARPIHLLDVSTSSALSERKSGITFRALADALGDPKFSIGTLSDVIRGRPGAMTQESENDLRRRLGLPVASTKTVEVCPSCLAHGKIEVHGEGLDCRGAPVVAVVTLAPGESVRRHRHAPGKARPPCYRPRLALDKPTRRVQLLKLLEDCA